VSRKWRNWYQNEVDEEIKGVDSRDTVKRGASRPGLSLLPPGLPPRTFARTVLSYSVFDFIFFLIFRFCAVR